MAKGRERGKRMNARKACNSLLLTHLGVGSSLLDIGYWKEVRDPPRTQTHGHKIARRQHLNVITILFVRQDTRAGHPCPAVPGGFEPGQRQAGVLLRPASKHAHPSFAARRDATPYLDVPTNPAPLPAAISRRGATLRESFRRGMSRRSLQAKADIPAGTILATFPSPLLSPSACICGHLRAVSLSLSVLQSFKTVFS